MPESVIVLTRKSQCVPWDEIRVAPETWTVHSCSYIQEVTSGYGPNTNADDYGSGSVPVTVLSGPVTGPQ